MNTPEDRDAVVSRFREGPRMLERTVAGLLDADLDARPVAGGWSIRQIIHHIADGDDIWKMCIKMAMGNEQAEFALHWYWPFTQETWAEAWAYSQRSIDVSLSLLEASRDHILQLLASVPDAWERSVTFRTRQGEIERIPVGFVVQMQADHLMHHLERIRVILQSIPSRRGK